MTEQSHTSSSVALPSLLNKQLILVSGKGGVGKTTMSVFLAHQLAKEGKKVLLCHMNRLSEDPWEKEFLGSCETLTQVTITPESCFKEYVLIKLKSEKLYNMFFERFSALNILRRAAPALSELLLLGKIYYECMLKHFWVTPKWDHVIVDLPATGHAMTLLNIPNVIMNIFPKGIVSKETQHIKNLIQDKERTALVLVTIPEFMAFQETLNFANMAGKKLKIPLGPILINRVPRPVHLLEEDKYSEIESKLSEKTSDMIDFFQTKRASAKQHIAKFQETYQKPLYEIPLVFGGTSSHRFEPMLNATFSDFFTSSELR